MSRVSDSSNEPSLTELIHAGLQHHRAGRYDAAGALYQHIIERDPTHFDALNLYGALLRQIGQSDMARTMLERALLVDAQQAIAHCNLGAVWQDLGRDDHARLCYERALTLKPDYVLALTNHAAVCLRQGDANQALRSARLALSLDENSRAAWIQAGLAEQASRQHEAALTCFDRARQLDTRSPEAWCHLATALQSLRRDGDALDCVERALALKSDFPEALTVRAQLLVRVGRAVEAVSAWKDALRERPDYLPNLLGHADALAAVGQCDAAVLAYESARAAGAEDQSVDYALAAIGRAKPPAASPVQYVESLFDAYAAHFDTHLEQVLGYGTPSLLLQDACEQPAQRSLDILDIGCGTGLCAPLLRPVARSLVGVDLSSRMLDQARDKGLYDSLHHADILEFLARDVERHDWVVAADVLVYFGDLLPVMNALRKRLRSGGRVFFSVELGSADEPYGLQPSRRFAHSTDYLNEVARACAYDVVRMEKAVLRRDRDADIQGLLLCWRVAS